MSARHGTGSPARPRAAEGFARERQALIRSATPGADAARRLSDVADRAVTALAEDALSALHDPWAVIALGGWGARRLLPRSDLDVLVVTDAPSEALRPAVSAMLYPLWDAGIEVGHQVRTRAEHLRRTREDMHTLTATLTGRAIAGDSRLGERLLSDVAKRARVRRRAVLREMAARDRPGSPFLLEPDLKDGVGGQRDLDEMVWTAAVLTGSRATGLEQLADAGLLSSAEVGSLEEAAERLTAARWRLHAASTRGSNLLTLESAADMVGLESELPCSLAEVHHALVAVRARAAGGDVARTTAPMTADEVLAALERPDAVPVLEEAAWGRLLDDVVPGMSDLVTLRRPDVGHTYTVGAHSIRTASLLARSERVRTLPASVRRSAIVAGLLHDVGKVHRGRGHPARGARMAVTLAPRFGLDPAACRDVELLVREHLLLAQTATAEDLHDEDVILRVASRVRRPDMLAALHELTAADSRSTGPGSWTPWTESLVGELVERVRAALVEEGADVGLAPRAAAHRSAALRMARDDPGVARFVNGAPLRYLASQRPGDMPSHAKLVAAARRPGEGPQVAVTSEDAPRTWRVTVAARDRRGLFAALAGAFTLCGLDILSAHAFSASDGIALDVFVVSPDTLADVDDSTWASFERHLSAALLDPRGTEARVATRRVDYATGSGEAPTVWMDRTGAYATAVHVSALDRVGLLYDLSRAIEESDLDVRWARSTSRGGRVLDVFHVVDAEGEPVDDPGVIGHLAMRMRERAAGDAR